MLIDIDSESLIDVDGLSGCGFTGESLVKFEPLIEAETDALVLNDEEMLALALAELEALSLELSEADVLSLALTEAEVLSLALTEAEVDSLALTEADLLALCDKLVEAAWLAEIL